MGMRNENGLSMKRGVDVVDLLRVNERDAESLELNAPPALLF